MSDAVKVEREPPLALCAAMVVDPLQLPAAFLNDDGQVCHANDRWTALEPHQAPVGTLPDSRALEATACNAAKVLSADPELFIHTVVFDATTMIQVTRFVGKELWMRGYVATLVPRDNACTPGERKQLDYVCDNDNFGVWTFDMSTGVHFFSQSWSRLRGYPEAEQSFAEREEWVNRIHPSDLDRVVQVRNHLYDNLREEVFDEYRERHRDGHWIWIMSHAKVVSRCSDGSPKQIIGIDANVSHLRLGTATHEDLSRRLQLAMSASDIGIWEYDVVRDEVKWDQRTRALYNLNDPRLVLPGSIWATFLHPDDRAQAIAVAEKATQDITDLDTQFRVIHNDGTERHLRTRATHLTDEDGRLMLLGVTWDVTSEAEQAAEIKLAYAMLKERNAALEEAHSQLKHRSNHDALTGLANRHKLDQFQQETFARIANRPIRCAAIQMDVDRFKAINDTLGHAAGDAVLRHVAQILLDAAPAEAIVARVGGDEFAILLPDAPPDPIIGHWANGVIRQAEIPFTYEGHSCRFSISIGIATDLCVQEDAQQLFTRADLALYEAKRAGRSAARFYSTGLQIAAQAKRHASDDILAALETDQFRCHYQPQYNSTGDTITGIEALARWHHPTRGVLGPAHFLSLSEELGVIAKIDDLILKAALEDAHRWQKAGKRVPRIFVNVSGQRLLDPLLPDRIAFLRYSPIQIGFELLETVFLDQTDPHLDGNLRFLRDLNIAVDVDDFGTGHASILSLRNLRPDRIKIDRQLIQSVTEDPEQRALVRTIVSLGQVMGMQIVAEGVATQAHIETLQTLGCDYLQGYGLCRPVSPNHMVGLLPPI